MTRQNLLAGSLALNVGLLLVIGYQISHPRAGKERTGQLAAMRAAQPQSFKHQKAASSGTSQGQPAPGFNWRQVESSDYSTYIANMRAVGVPEQTIRDVIIADVTQAYEARRAALLATRRKPFMYWETADRRRLSPAEMQELEKQEMELDEEMNSVLTQLLGSDYDPEQRKGVAAEVDSEQRLDFLSQARRDQLLAIVKKYDGLEEQVKALADWNAPTDDPAEWKQILKRYAEKKAELAQLLTPEEYELYELNTSWTAENLRQAMMAFKPTEEEFREIFKEWRAHDENLAVMKAEGEPDPGNGHVFAAIKEALGEERYQEYRRDWWNGDYHELYQLTQDNRLPEQVAGEVYDLKKTAQQQRNRILADSSMSTEQRIAALQSVQTATDAAVAARLGDRAYQQYRTGSGRWIQSLGKISTPPAAGP